ncbi:hypothetical protein RHMOL_Rhmol05G0061900 [Rhododendron molle]|uniref:Uncharacterized protein n=1 Tax=Rhododendron molle TaxID=49168 RepID=A0ACC0NLA8_RHOML|nr:hypothetical protein RHMOL_Rhmol05G0061900 [Rhododendron molle]
MAATRAMFFSLLILSTTLFQIPRPCNGNLLRICNFHRIYQLGDSISDTGNLIRESPMGAASPFSRLPYGETFFHNATGRCSNGLLMIDYIAMSAGLPLLDAYKNTGADFKHGVDFAVAGSTALPVETLADQNILSPVTTSSLGVQLDWMSTHFNSTCDSGRDCAEKLKDSLFMVGEIGGNDYNYALFQGKSIDEVKSLVPSVVQAIANAVRRVINHGAVRVVVPGNFPIGCLPIYLTGFKTNNSTAYDDNNCLRDLNELSKFHNDQVQGAISELNKEFPNAVITYGDYYNAFDWLFRNAAYLGFDASATQRSCCGAGGDYNFNLGRMCGAPDVPVCRNPDRLISWDGIHLTQKAYKLMTAWLLRDLLPKLQCRL